MLTVLNVADPREVIVIALTESSAENASQLLEIDATERFRSPLDDVIEPSIDRAFGFLVAEDDLSSTGPIEYCPPAVGGVATDLTEVQGALKLGAELLAPYLRKSSD